MGWNVLVMLVWLAGYFLALRLLCGALHQGDTLLWLFCQEWKATNKGIFTFSVDLPCLLTTVEFRTLQVKSVSSSLLNSLVRSRCDLTHTWYVLTCSLFDFSFWRNYRLDLNIWTSFRRSSRSLFSTAPTSESLCSLRGQETPVGSVSQLWVSETRSCAEQLWKQWDGAWLEDATAALDFER